MLLKLRENEVFASAVIKRRYWPAIVPGKAIDEYCAGMEVGATEALKGGDGGIKCDIFCSNITEGK